MKGWVGGWVGRRPVAARANLPPSLAAPPPRRAPAAHGAQGGALHPPQRHGQGEQEGADSRPVPRGCCCCCCRRGAAANLARARVRPCIAAPPPRLHFPPLGVLACAPLLLPPCLCPQTHAILKWGWRHAGQQTNQYSRVGRVPIDIPPCSPSPAAPFYTHPASQTTQTNTRVEPRTRRCAESATGPARVPPCLALRAPRTCAGPDRHPCDRDAINRRLRALEGRGEAVDEVLACHKRRPRPPCAAGPALKNPWRSRRCFSSSCAWPWQARARPETRRASCPCAPAGWGERRRPTHPLAPPQASAPLRATCRAQAASSWPKPTPPPPTPPPAAPATPRSTTPA